jgi:hypothetical protein
MGWSEASRESDEARDVSGDLSERAQPGARTVKVPVYRFHFGIYRAASHGALMRGSSLGSEHVPCFLVAKKTPRCRTLFSF